MLHKNLDYSPSRNSKLNPENYGKNTERYSNTPNQRKTNHRPDTSPRRRRQRRDVSPQPTTSKGERKFESPPPTHKKMIETLEGKVSGLRDATALHDENERLKN